MQPLFDHEKLRVYKAAINFVAWCEPLLLKLPKSLSAHDQLDRASTSIPLNIAEGNGKFTAPDRCRFFDTARGSALECAACLDVVVAKLRVGTDEIIEGKQLLADIVSMLVGLIKSNSGARVFEETLEYGGSLNE
ncbi:MAG: four helix bundle protein [Verrucomicrobiaceae bacterium]|nr:MAG: four helix bundle protein [Verrucomicrobiaceae bacterium]